MKRILNLFMIGAALSVMMACTEKTPEPTPDAGKPDNIAGTDITSSANLYGRITDVNGKPVSGVSVSDGRTVVQTDGNGVFQMTRSRLSHFVFYTTPSGYEVNVGSDGLPLFYQAIDQSQDFVECNFTLTPLTSSESKFALLCLADPQCRSTDNISRFRAESVIDINRTISKLEGEGTPVYAVTLGDIIFDTPELWSNMKSAMNEINAPVFQTIGNHDHLANSANETDAEANFESHFGPRNYSFDRGNAHIVVMDNVIYTGGAGGNNYRGGISNIQLSWLEADLKPVPKSKVVVFCAHIPFRNHDDPDDESYQNAEEVLDLLSEFAEAHIMIGHTHYNENYIHNVNGKTIIEHIHGAVCGAWWYSNFCVDGAPNGYGVYTFNGSSVDDYYYKATNTTDDGFQMRAYPGAAVFGSTATGSTTFGWGANSSTYSSSKCIVVNVWNAIIPSRSSALAWKVELYQNGSKVCDMTQRSVTEWWAYGNFVLNHGRSTTSTYSNSRNHMYYGLLKSGDAVNDSDADLNFEIRVTDQFGNVYTCNTLQRTL